MKNIFKKFKVENKFTKEEINKLDRIVFSKIGAKNNSLTGQLWRVLLITGLVMLIPLVLIIFNIKPGFNPIITTVTAQSILQEAASKLESIISNANFVQYNILINRENNPVNSYEYEKDQILVQIDTTNQRYNVYDSKSSDFVEITKSDGVKVYLPGKGLSRLVRGDKEFYGYIEGEIGGNGVSLERIQDLDEMSSYYQYPTGVLEQMQINHLVYYQELIDFMKSNLSVEGYIEETLQIADKSYHVYTINFEYKYTAFDINLNSKEQMFNVTIYIDKESKLPIRIRDERKIGVHDAKEIITTDFVNVKFKTLAQAELDEVFKLNFDPTKVRKSIDYITSSREVELSGRITSRNLAEIYNVPIVTTSQGSYEIKSKKFYDEFTNQPTLLGKFLQGKQVAMKGIISGNFFVPFSFKLISSGIIPVITQTVEPTQITHTLTPTPLEESAIEKEVRTAVEKVFAEGKLLNPNQQMPKDIKLISVKVDENDVTLNLSNEVMSAGEGVFEGIFSLVSNAVYPIIQGTEIDPKYPELNFDILIEGIPLDQVL